MVLVMGTSNCYMMNHTLEKVIPGLAGVVKGGILPGLVGYEAGQAAVGDAFAWLSATTGQDSAVLEAAALDVAPGADGVLCIDHFHGCRTPLMDPNVRGQFHGLSLATTPPVLYAALTEGTAMGCKRVMNLLSHAGVAPEVQLQR